MEQFHLFQNRTNTNPPQYHPQASISDCESGISGPLSSPSWSSSSSSSHIFPQNLLVKLPKQERAYDVLQQRFLSCIESSPFGGNTKVVSVHRMNWLDGSNQDKVRRFQVVYEAVKEKNGGEINVKFGWYGNGKECIERIVEHGFSVFDALNNVHGAVLVFPDHSPASCIEESIEDEDGLRHVMLCRVIVGRPELIQLGSCQTHPSSTEFDSGVDNLENPNKYIIWSTNMNSHILPEFVISFRVSNQDNNLRMPRLPFMPFPALINVLAKYLPDNAICLINKLYKNYKERKITRRDLIKGVRQTAGDDVLISVIKSCTGTKDLKSSMEFLRKRKQKSYK